MTTPLAHRPEAAAELLGFSRATVYELLRTGALPSFKVGRSRRISHRALEEFVERCEAQSDLDAGSADPPAPSQRRSRPTSHAGRA